MTLRKANVSAVFPSLIRVWTTTSIIEELSISNSCGIATAAKILLPLYYSLLSFKNSQLLLTIEQN